MCQEKHPAKASDISAILSEPAETHTELSAGGQLHFPRGLVGKHQRLVVAERGRRAVRIVREMIVAFRSAKGRAFPERL